MKRLLLAAVTAFALLASGCASTMLGLSSKSSGIGSDLADALTVDSYNLSLIFTIIIPWNPLVYVLGTGISVVDLGLGIPLYPFVAAYGAMTGPPAVDAGASPEDPSTPPVGADED
jgi:hypothetical protein